MRTVLLAFSLMVLLSSCNLFGGERISGNGNIVSRQQNAGNFNSIDVSGSITVHIRQDAASSVKVETDENLLEYLDVFVEGSTLVVKPKSGYNLRPTKDLIVYASAPQFKYIEASGACDVISDNMITGNAALEVKGSGSVNMRLQVTLPQLTTRISGSGEAVLKGSVQNFSGRISGSGSIKAFDLATDNCTLDISGSGDAQVTANQKLEVEVSGSGDVEYKGNATVSKSISGSGSVKKVG